MLKLTVLYHLKEYLAEEESDNSADKEKDQERIVEIMGKCKELRATGAAIFNKYSL